MVERNGMLKTLSIIAIISGALGLFSILSGVAAIVFEDVIESAFIQNQGEIAKVQKEMQTELKEKLELWKPFTYGSLFLKAGVVSLLLFGGVKAYRMASDGRKLLLTAFVAGILFEALSLYPMFRVQQLTVEVTTKYQKRLMEAQQPPGAKMPVEAEAIFETAMKIGLLIGLLITVGWILLKLLFYAYGIYYMRKPEVVTLYEGEGSSEDFWEDTEE